MAREIEVYNFSIGKGSGGSIVEKVLSLMGENDSITILDTDSVFSHLHLASAVMHAARSILRGEARARAEPLEIIRWLTGSHQVSKGLDIAAPGESTADILVVKVPSDWPAGSDTTELPSITEKEWRGSLPDGWTVMRPPFDLGGVAALKRMGMTFDEGTSAEEMERSVLEAVCTLGL